MHPVRSEISFLGSTTIKQYLLFQMSIICLYNRKRFESVSVPGVTGSVRNSSVNVNVRFILFTNSRPVRQKILEASKSSNGKLFSFTR